MHDDDDDNDADGDYLGLRLTLNVRQANYRSLSTCDTAGVRLLVLDQNQMPFPEDLGLTLSPGHYTAVAVSTVRHLKYNTVDLLSFYNLI